MSRLAVPALLLALVVPVTLAPPTAAVPAERSASAEKARCGSTAISGRMPIRTRSGAKLGTARMYTGTRGEDLGFCVRITPVRKLRSKYTIAMIKDATYDEEGNRTSYGLIGGSGAWKHPFVYTGTIYGPGDSMKAAISLKPSRGKKGTVTLRGTLG